MTRNEALEKVKKCLALASSPEPHEAAAALRQAQKLMAQFGLTEIDVSLSDVSEFAQAAQNTPLVKWEAMLAVMIAEAFGCDQYTSTRPQLMTGLKVRYQRRFVFIGVGPAPEIAGYAFDLLARQCAKDRRAHMGQQHKNCKPKTRVARGDLYAEGWIAGVRDKVERFAGTERDAELIDQYMRERHPDMKSANVRDRTKGKNVSHTDWQHGVKAGRNAELNRGLHGGVAEPQLLGAL